jgi:hypothetical protein
MANYRYTATNRGRPNAGDHLRPQRRDRTYQILWTDGAIATVQDDLGSYHQWILLQDLKEV